MDLGSLGAGGVAELVGVTTLESGDLGPAQAGASLEQRGDVLGVAAGQLVEAPGDDRRLAQGLDGGAGPLALLFAAAAGEGVPGLGELLEGEAVELVDLGVGGR